VDLPPIAVEHPVPWIANTLQPTDAALLVVDLSEPDCVERVGYLLHALRERRVYPSASWDAPDEQLSAVLEADPFAKTLPALLVATKADLDPSPQEDLRVFEDLVGLNLPMLAVSVVTGEGLDRLGPWLFEKLHVVRVYTKAPGRPPDRDKPFTVRRGDTVAHVAALIHQDIAAALKFARLWRGADTHGQQVGRDYPVEDGDVLELHA
jgi:ribosome-interacting GTPase 1